MPISVVYTFEPNLYRSAPPILGKPCRAAARICRTAHSSIAPVRQSRQLIRPRLFFQQFALGVDLPVQIDDPATHPYPCQQFSRIKRLGQIVVSASGKTPYNTILLPLTGKHDDIGIRAIHLGADALAEFQSAEIRHIPVRNYNGWSVSGEKTKPFLAVLGE